MQEDVQAGARPDEPRQNHAQADLRGTAPRTGHPARFVRQVTQTEQASRQSEAVSRLRQPSSRQLR